jgi:hypothetical protein
LSESRKKEKRRERESENGKKFAIERTKGCEIGK